MSGEWIDGRKLVAYLEDRGYQLSQSAIGHHARAVRHWRNGGAASIFQADALLIKLDLHPDLLPEDMWLEESPLGGKSRTYPRATKERALALLADGMTINAASVEIGCDPKSIKNWKKAAA